MKHISLFLPSFVTGILLFSCTGKKSEDKTTGTFLKTEDFQTQYEGKATDLVKLQNKNGMEAFITNFGGRVVALNVPDRDGNLQDVVLGFDRVEDYFPENNLTDFGASIGRYANRIKDGKLPIDGDTIKLPTNNFGHTLHGGPSGWQYKVYDIKEATDSTLTLAITSADGDNNFPGKVTALVKYTLTNDNALDIEYSATTDAPTVINMTNHSYFNLSGNPRNTIENHEIRVKADAFTPVDTTYIPTGEILAVAGTPMDLNSFSRLGDRINDKLFEQIKTAKGFDHNWVLATEGNIDIPAVELYSPESGILMTVHTTEPGIQVYTGNFLDGTILGKGKISYDTHAGLCLETQHYPDSPNHPEWPSTRLNPDEEYRSHTIYRFSTK
ncbi:MAG: galactose mutarotase [Muribaculaceae bacterium]|nr:galactose mutarotase [Muribaculaceae bacterium]